jgi:hypothetical protein
MAIIEDPITNAKLSISTAGEAQVNLPATAAAAGFVKLLDSLGGQINTTENGALNTSTDSLLFYEQVDGAAIDLRKWNQSVSGMTITQGSGFQTLNAAAAVTAGAYAILSSIQYIPLYGHLPARATFNLRIPIVPQSNLTIEFGIGSVATNAAPTDGAYFRYSPSGNFYAGINNGGVETLSAALTPISTAQAEIFDIVIVEDLVQFQIGDEVVATIEVPPGQAYPTSSGRLPVFMRVYNSGSAPAQAPQLLLGQIVVVQEALNQTREWRECLAILGGAAYQSPVTPFAQTANHANSTSPSSASLSNTAAGYTTLGGRYQFAAVASAATDFALFAFQVPAGYRLIVTGVSISCSSIGAVGSAVTPTLLDWGLGVNSSAVSLATADGAGTWAPRRIPLGVQAFPLTAAIAQLANDIVRTFDPPLVVDSGRFFHVIMQVPLGAATASQLLRGNVNVQGFFE